MSDGEDDGHRGCHGCGNDITDSPPSATTCGAMECASWAATPDGAWDGDIAIGHCQYGWTMGTATPACFQRPVPGTEWCRVHGAETSRADEPIEVEDADAIRMAGDLDAIARRGKRLVDALLNVRRLTDENATLSAEIAELREALRNVEPT